MNWSKYCPYCQHWKPDPEYPLGGHCALFSYMCATEVFIGKTPRGFLKKEEEENEKASIL